MKIGLVIKELRIKKGMTQEELADKTELSARTIQRIENGEVDPRAYSLQVIAQALEVDFELFMEARSQDEGAEKNDRLTLGLLHLSGILPLFFPTYLLWKRNKNRLEGKYTHFYDVISLQLTVWLLFILPGIAIHLFQSINHIYSRAIILVLIGPAFGMFISIVNTISVMNDRPYKRFSLINKKKQTDSD